MPIPNKREQDITALSISLPRYLADKIRQHAKDNDQTVSQLIRAAVNSYLPEQRQSRKFGHTAEVQEQIEI